MPAGRFKTTVANPDDFQDVKEYARYLAGLMASNFGEMNWLFGNLDSVNIRKLSADRIVAGTILASLVTIKAALDGGATITIDGNGFVASFDTGTTITIDETGLKINNGTKDTFKADKNGNVTAEDGTITGGTVRTASTGARVELSNNTLKTYSAGNKLQGFAWGTDVTGNTYGDAFLYHSDTKLVEFYDEITNYVIRGVSPATGLAIGGNGVTIYPRGNWSFGSAAVSGLSINSVNNLESRLSDIEDRLSALESGA